MIIIRLGSVLFYMKLSNINFYCPELSFHCQKPFPYFLLLNFSSYLSKNLHFIDVENMAVYGWNYGGYMTVKMMAQDTNDLFRCGAAIAPISKWEFLGQFSYILCLVLLS